MHRIRQGIVSLSPAPDLFDASLIAASLTPVQIDALRELPRHDRNHLFRVGTIMIQQAPGNQDLIVAAFLHDIGKSCQGFHVRLIDRVAKVLLQATSPGFLRRISTPPPSRIRGGLVLAVHHPAFGAERAKSLGCSERTCWLIAHHEDVRDIDDPDLALLAALDDATP